jgi:hypothetical protein
MEGIGNYIMKADYGGGAFRRRIRLERHGNAIRGALEDCNHGFKVNVHFDEKSRKVTGLEPDFKRIPFTTCPGAAEPLGRLIGASIDSTVPELYKIAPPLQNCTHLHDLTLLAINHAGRGEDVLQYDIEVTDAEDNLSWLRVWRNDELIHEWQAKYGEIVAPAGLQGKPLFQGFFGWAGKITDPVEQEAAFVLQKGNLVAIGRMIDVEGMAGGLAIDESDRHACHTYSPEHAKQAVRLAGTTRDFTDHPEKLLNFE